MAQHDYILANQSGASFRADLNNALAAVVSQNSGAAEPSVTYAYMPWADTTNGLFKIRNAANSGWITLYQLDGEWSTIALEDGTAAAPSLYFKDSGTDTGAYSPGADQFAIATGGVQRVNFNGSTEVVFNDGGADVDFRIEGDTDANLFKVDAGLDQVIISSIAYPKTDGSAGQVLKTNGSGTLSFTSPTVDQGPTFRATLGSGTPGISFTSSTDTKIPYNTVTFDTDSCYDNTTNYRFTPTKAGYYLTTASCAITFGAGGHPNIINHYITVYKNGSAYAWGNHSRYSTSTSEWFIGTQSCTTLVYMNGSTDYLEGYVLSTDVNPSMAKNEGSFFESTWVHN